VILGVVEMRGIVVEYGLFNEATVSLDDHSILRLLSLAQGRLIFTKNRPGALNK
jgi:hypothetical protein